MIKHRNIKIWADYNSSGLFDDDTFEPLLPRDLVLPQATWSQLEQWCVEYSTIVPMDTKTRMSGEVQARIKSLDQQGLRLAREICEILGTDYRLRYFSEGQGVFLVDK